MNNYPLKRSATFRGMRTKRDVTERIVQSIKDAAVIIAIALGGLLMWNTSVLSETIVKETTMKERLEAVVLSCLEHGGMFINGELYLCRPVATGIKENLK